MSFEVLPRHFVEKPWGQAGLPAEFGGRSEKVGEIWFDRADHPLPLLCKWLFTSEKLSVQVHPSDNEALGRGLQSGKEECWIVTNAAEGATLGIGMTRELSDEALREASLSGEIEQILDWKPVKPGDWFYIPAGTIHAIGAGVQLVEIQQNADITYRLYDYGRPRELHLEDGIAVAETSPYAGASGNLSHANGNPFVDSRYFSLSVLDADDDLSNSASENSYLVPLNGEFDTPGGVISRGMVAYGQGAQISALGSDCRLLVAQEA